ncbi:MAG: alkaline phosphatase family protein [Bacteriovoracia bacterium]
MISLLGSTFAQAMDLGAFLRRPKLVVVIVIDQFRADYLTRYEAKFLPAGSSAEPGGFRYLLEKGAYFPFAEYDVLQNMTCPGHAMILTGTRPATNGITLNDWYDRKEKKIAYCVADAQYGLSPRKLLTTTVGDELKNVNVESKTVAVALKDRAAILLGGRNANGVAWFDNKKKEWVSSGYYEKSGTTWLNKFNESMAPTIKALTVKELMRSTAAATMTVDAALAAATAFSLGANEAPDLLAVSFSSHDYLGHQVGPNSPFMLDMTLVEDKEISRLIGALGKKVGGMDNLVVALTADHGVAPLIEVSKAAKIDAGGFEYASLNAKLNGALSKAFGTPKSKNWIAAGHSLHIYFDEGSLREKKVSARKAEVVAKAVLLKEPGVLGVLTKSEFLDGSYRNGPLATEVSRSYLPEIGGDLVILPRPYFIELDGYPGNHNTNWAYDRMVPLVITGMKVKPGVYSGAKVIDLAPTLSFLLGTLPPATNEGRVLSEIFK